MKLNDPAPNAPRGLRVALALLTAAILAWLSAEVVVGVLRAVGGGA